MANVTSKTVPGKNGSTRKVYLAIWAEGGKTREKSFAMKREANSFAAEMQKKSGIIELTPTKTKQLGAALFEDVAQDYLKSLETGGAGRDPLEPQTLRTYRGYLESHAIPYFALYASALASIQKSNIEGLRDFALKRVNSNKSVKEVVRLAKAVLSHAVERGLIESVPGRDVKVRSSRKERIKAQVSVAIVEPDAVSDASACGSK